LVGILIPIVDFGFTLYGLGGYDGHVIACDEFVLAVVRLPALRKVFGTIHPVDAHINMESIASADLQDPSYPSLHGCVWRAIVVGFDVHVVAGREMLIHYCRSLSIAGRKLSSRKLTLAFRIKLSSFPQFAGLNAVMHVAQLPVFERRGLDLIPV
jgi:hypothetical protein